MVNYYNPMASLGLIMIPIGLCTYIVDVEPLRPDFNPFHKKNNDPYMLNQLKGIKVSIGCGYGTQGK